MTRNRGDRLGRGLEALIGDFLDPGEPGREATVRQLPVAEIRPNPFQPRKEFSSEELQELAASIREHGLLQPLVVRPAGEERGGWELVAGERRLRAVADLGWEKVPAWVREVDDRTLLVLAMVENLQREALGPLEEAEGYRALAESFGLTQGQIAEAVGKDRSTVANALRLLQLPPSVRKLLAEGVLTPGHARPLLALKDPLKMAELARACVRGGWSVRKVEAAVKARTEKSEPAAKREPSPADSALMALQEELRRVLGTRVVLRRTKRGKGVIEIPFVDAEDFERIFALVAGREASDVLG